MTRADVARFAGVSTAVVSYVVSGGRPVAPRTAARVREAVDILGYRPNLSARALRKGSTEMLGLILSDSTNPYFAEFAREIEIVAAERGYALLTANAHGDGRVGGGWRAICWVCGSTDCSSAPWTADPTCSSLTS